MSPSQSPFSCDVPRQLRIPACSDERFVWVLVAGVLRVVPKVEEPKDGEPKVREPKVKEAAPRKVKVTIKKIRSWTSGRSTRSTPP